MAATPTAQAFLRQARNLARSTFERSGVEDLGVQVYSFDFEAEADDFKTAFDTKFMTAHVHLTTDKRFAYVRMDPGVNTTITSFAVAELNARPHYYSHLHIQEVGRAGNILTYTFHDYRSKAKTPHVVDGTRQLRPAPAG